MYPTEDLPRVLLFDIGGVCVGSPFHGIAQYERRNGIPAGYINHRIWRAGRDGSWQKLERGEVALDKDFFRAFKAELEDEIGWREFLERDGMKEAGSSSLFSPPPPPPPAAAAAATAAPLPPPTINPSNLITSMMDPSQHPDPHMYTALLRLQASQKFTLAALSNTIIFPPPSSSLDHHEQHHHLPPTLTSLFTPFISSAHIGMRKPEPRIYEYTLSRLQTQYRQKEPQRPPLLPSQILFLDDIGANLKPARALGMRTLRVGRDGGGIERAVRELGEVLGLDLGVGIGFGGVSDDEGFVGKGRHRRGEKL